MNTIKQNILDSKEIYIRKILEENKLLIEQIQILQEEIENNYNKTRLDNIEYDYPQKKILSKFNELLIENLKLKNLTKIQEKALVVEKKNSLYARLGSILVNGVSSPQKFILLPFKLCKIWKSYSKKNPPSLLGGQSYQKLFDIYSKGGIDSVENLLNSISITSKERANCYTALARYLQTDPKQAAMFARLAWEIDPCPYRLKWLAFRLHEAGDSITADNILNMITNDIIKKDSEIAHIQHIKRDSKIEIESKARNELDKLKLEIFDYDKLTKKISDLMKENKIVKKELTEKFNQQIDKYKEELNLSDKQLTEIKEYLNNSNKEKEILQHKLDVLNKENEALIIRMGKILKVILTKYETKSTIISQMIKIIIGENNK